METTPVTAETGQTPWIQERDTVAERMLALRARHDDLSGLRSPNALKYRYRIAADDMKRT
jgi:hypothetical protein